MKSKLFLILTMCLFTSCIAQNKKFIMLNCNVNELKILDKDISEIKLKDKLLLIKLKPSFSEKLYNFSKESLKKIVTFKIGTKKISDFKFNTEISGGSILVPIDDDKKVSLVLELLDGFKSFHKKDN